MHEYLTRLIDHLEWADARAVASLSSVSDPPAEALGVLAHVLGAEHVWIARLEQREARVAVWPELTVEECAELGRENVRALRRMLASWDADALAGEVPYTNSAGAAFRSRRDDILLHIVMHGMYHRGQVALLVRGAGLEPSPTDYIAFVRGAPAARTITATSAPRRNSSESAPR